MPFQAVTGCSLGKRMLRFIDYGKMVASFIIVAGLGTMDIVLVEDFHQEPRNKIAVLGATNEPLCK